MSLLIIRLGVASISVPQKDYLRRSCSRFFSSNNASLMYCTVQRSALMGLSHKRDGGALSGVKGALRVSERSQPELSAGQNGTQQNRVYFELTYLL